ncbi:uncharacterized protein LOC112544617 isoform X7 [Pelodiscus sinensis]|uniref:uncharacterized protein LOC112544617 isoform X7 n=1 Tax=Pelodiscus sinensis TaxID=13735 RepID=UPI003F6C9559
MSPRTLVLQEAACGLCRRPDSDPDAYGQKCRRGKLCVHENCLYHASGLRQRGQDEEGFYGFLYPDIRQALKRAAQKVLLLEAPAGATREAAAAAGGDGLRGVPGGHAGQGLLQRPGLPGLQARLVPPQLHPGTPPGRKRAPSATSTTDTAAATPAGACTRAAGSKPQKPACGSCCSAARAAPRGPTAAAPGWGAPWARGSARTAWGQQAQGRRPASSPPQGVQLPARPRAEPGAAPAPLPEAGDQAPPRSPCDPDSAGPASDEPSLPWPWPGSLQKRPGSARRQHGHWCWEELWPPELPCHWSSSEPQPCESQGLAQRPERRPAAGWQSSSQGRRRAEQQRPPPMGKYSPASFYSGVSINSALLRAV